MHKEIQRVGRFLIVGVGNVAIDIVAFKILRLFGMDPYIASALSYTLAMTNSFLQNRRWTFSDGQRHIYKQYGQFMVANAIGFVFNTGLMYFFLQYQPLESKAMNELAAKFLASAMIAVWNYSISRLIIFRPLSEKEKTSQATAHH